MDGEDENDYEDDEGDEGDGGDEGDEVDEDGDGFGGEGYDDYETYGGNGYEGGADVWVTRPTRDRGHYRGYDEDDLAHEAHTPSLRAAGPIPTWDEDLDPTEDEPPETTWKPFKEVPPPFDDWPDLPAMGKGKLYLREVFRREYDEVLRAMKNVQPTSGSIFAVTRCWRRYYYWVGKWWEDAVRPPDAWRRQPVVPCASRHFRDEVWRSPEGVHFNQVRDAFRKRDPACQERNRARSKEAYAALTPTERMSRAAKERERYAKRAANPEYLAKRAERERARRAALKIASEK